MLLSSGAWRGLAVVFGIVITPFAIATGLLSVPRFQELRGLPELAIFVYFLWGHLAFPLVLVTPSVSGPVQIALPLAQWSLIGVVLGHLMRRSSTPAIVMVTCATVVAVAPLVLVLLDVLGYRIGIDSM